MKAIEVSQLYFSYDNAGMGRLTPILNDLNMEIRAGEMVAIQGPSGSGKSTLLYLLGLLSEPTSGHIKITGQDIAELNEDELAYYRNRHIGFIFQQFHLLPKTSALDNILLPTQYARHKRSPEECLATAQKYAQLVGLSERLHHHPNQLSGGQQQRVAICRALMNEPEIILADEPTGNLDSIAAVQILELLRSLNRELKKTVIIITHDKEVAEKCDRIIHIKDGRIVGDPTPARGGDNQTKASARQQAFAPFSLRGVWTAAKESFPSALKNLGRNKTRTALTMVGISVGIAAVLSMMTLGEFTKTKILAGYAEMGVNTILFYGRPNWDQKATDVAPVTFRFFDWDRDLVRLRTIFPDIQRMSPVLTGWNGAVDYGGRSIEQDIQTMGASEDALLMSGRKFLLGRNFSKSEIEQKSGVCVIGYEIAERLFANTQPLGQVLKVTEGDNSFGCRVIGVLATTTTNKEYTKPNLQVYLPFTLYQTLAGDWWASQIKQVMIQTKEGADVEKIGKGLTTYFEQRYGSSGKFRVDSDSVLLAQMRRFLSLFTLLLSSIAFVTLAVGGVGIANMMLVAVSERFREIGLRKALGATNREIRTQFLVESMIVCAMAGFVGLLLGFTGYHLAIWAASKFVGKLQFEWTFDGLALLLSLVSIFVVGILSGIFPALKAEKLQVIEALRSE